MTSPPGPSPRPTAIPAAPDREVDLDTLRRAIALVQGVRDPALPGVLFMLGIALTGIAVLAYTASTMFGLRFVALQNPLLVSGGFGGVALVTVGAALAAIQLERRDRTRTTVQMGRITAEVTALVVAALDRRNAAHRRAGEPSDTSAEVNTDV